jgi:hypothetical protein
VCMKDGTVHEYEAPVLESYDVSKTFSISASIKYRSFKFKSVKSKLRVGARDFAKMARSSVLIRALGTI